MTEIPSLSDLVVEYGRRRDAWNTARSAYRGDSPHSLYETEKAMADAHSAIRSYVSATVQEAVKRYDWLAANCHRVIKTGETYSYVAGRGAAFRDYPSVDALVSEELHRERK